MLLLSDSEVIVQRNDLIAPPHLRGQKALRECKDAPTWGELESHGGVILDPLPEQDPNTPADWKVRATNS